MQASLSIHNNKK